MVILELELECTQSNNLLLRFEDMLEVLNNTEN